MRRIDVPSGVKFGRLTVVEEVSPHVQSNGEKKRKFLCQCDCGNEVEVQLCNLRNGNSKSCGCLGRENVIKSRKKGNVFSVSDSIGVGFTNKGTTFKFDADDYDKIKDYCWCSNHDGYLVARSKEGKIIRLHRLIMDASDGLVVDHINHDVTDNRKENLRVCTQHQNSMNTKCKGYYFNKGKQKWTAEIMVNRAKIHLGHFETQDEAKAARDVAKRKYFGEFAFGSNKQEVL